MPPHTIDSFVRTIGVLSGAFNEGWQRILACCAAAINGATL
jgi:hypothetical protein